MNKLLSEYSEKLENWKSKIRNNEEFIDSLIGISVNIAYETPNTYPFCFRIISELIDKYDSGDKIEKAKDILKKIKNKFADKINDDSLDIWMQRLSYKLDPNIEYKCDLCKIISAKKDPIIWESSWLSKIPREKTKLTKEQLKSIEEKIKLTINWHIINDMSPAISQNEVDDFITY